jgi:uncharacterized membrane protein
MFDTVFGLPVHPLVVHAVVVLTPAAALGVLAIALRPSWRPRYGPLVIGITAVATLLTPIATQSGESLSERVGEPEEHAELGDTLVFFMLPLLALAIALWWLDRRDRAASAASMSSAGVATQVGASTATRVVAVLAVVAAVAAGVQIARIGHSGAEATWSDVEDSGPAQGDDDD